MSESEEKRALETTRNAKKKSSAHASDHGADGLHVLTFMTLLPRTAGLLMQLLWMWMTLGWQVRKARKAFEKELVREGISKRDAQRLSRQLKIAKDQMIHSIWRSGGR